MTISAGCSIRSATPDRFSSAARDARLLGRGGAGVVLQRLARQRGQAVPVGAHVVRTADPGHRPDPRLERGGARRVVAAHAHADGADAVEVDVVAAGEHVEHCGDRDLVVGADVEREAGLALARPVHRERRHAASSGRRPRGGRTPPWSSRARGSARRAAGARRPRAGAGSPRAARRRTAPRRARRSGPAARAPPPSRRSPSPSSRGCARRRRPRRTSRSGRQTAARRNASPALSALPPAARPLGLLAVRVGRSAVQASSQSSHRSSDDVTRRKSL